MEFENLRELGQRVRLVVCDLDGTLLNSKKEISERSVQAIVRAQQKGVYVTICSGRIYPMLGYYIQRLGIDGPVISANGAAIVNATSGAVLAGAALNEADAQRLLLFCKDKGVDYSVLTGDASYFAADSERIERFRQYNKLATAEGHHPMELRFFDETHRCVIGQDIYKILVYERAPGELDQVKAFLETHTQLAYTSSEDRLLDISSKGVSKGEGLKKLAGLLGVPMESTCAFGDYDNDLSMLQAAGFSVAMHNGCVAAKKAADYVTGTNEEDGVADALEKFIL